MAENIELAMHNDHRHWLSDYAMWNDDLDMWQKEIAEAIASLHDAEAALSENCQGFQVHASELRLEQKLISEHEHGIAEYERGAFGSSESLQRLSDGHKGIAAQHASRRSAHERLKRHHHAVIAQVTLLMKALTKSV